MKDDGKLDELEKKWFEIAESTFKKHFTQWLSLPLLPLIIAGDPEIATLFAKLLFHPSPQVQQNPKALFPLSLTSSGEMHLHDASVIEGVKSELKNYLTAIELIANGESIWNYETNNEELKNLRIFCKKHYLPLPSNSQHIEAGVKDSALVAQTGCEERSRNNKAIIRSHTVRNVIREAQKYQEHKKEDAKDYSPHGRMRTLYFLKGAKRDALRGASLSAESKSTAKGHLSKENDFKRKRQESLVDKVKTAQDKRLNTAQQLTGVDYTVSISGLIRYSFIVNAQMQNVRRELDARGVIYEENDGVMKLRKALKGDEDIRGAQDSKAFKPIVEWITY